MVAHVVNDGDRQQARAVTWAAWLESFGDDTPWVKVDSNPRFSPNELRTLKAQTGRTLDGIMNNPEDAVQAMVWRALRKQGLDPDWDACADIEAEFQAPEQPDPFTGEVSTT